MPPFFPAGAPWTGRQEVRPTTRLGRQLPVARSAATRGGVFCRFLTISPYLSMRWDRSHPSGRLRSHRRRRDARAGLTADTAIETGGQHFERQESGWIKVALISDDASRREAVMPGEQELP